MAERPRAAGPFLRRAVCLLAAGALSLLIALEAPAQCSLDSAPAALTPPAWRYTSPAEGFTTVAPYLGLYRKSSGADRLLVPMTWGWVLYDLSSPAYPAPISIYDLRFPVPGPGFPTQDGQSYGPGFAVSPDGQRVVNSLSLSTGETVVSIPNSRGETADDPFLPMGNTGLQNAKVVVQKRAGRYVVYGLTSYPMFFAADVTTLTSFSQTNRIPFDYSFSLGSSAQTLGLAEGLLGSYLYSITDSGVAVVDVSNPGASPNITSDFTRNVIPTSAFGLAGPGLRGVSAAVEPASGKLYVLGSFWDAQGVPSFSLVLYDPGTTSATLVGKYTAPFETGAPSFTSAGGVNAGAVAVNPSTGDVWTFMWVRSASLGRYRLYATLARNFGRPIGLSAELSGPSGYLSGTTVLFKSDASAYVYFLDGTNPWAAGLSCQAGPTPATGRLSVTNATTGQAVASGDTVFVGDTLTIAPSVAPTNAVQAVTAWNLDLDFHDPAERGTVGLTQLVHPDACFTGCPNAFSGNPDPPPSGFTLVGPCDPRNGGNPVNGAGCWNSVKETDFAGAPPVSGWLAFEAQNALNTTTVPLAQFKLVWQLPTAGLQGLSALLNGTSATLQADTSRIGHPTAYRWYFGSSNTAPPGETLSLDSGCTGPSCTHNFAAGKGSYNAWLTTVYRNEYSTPGCGTPCVAPAGVAVVSVTDFVASFTAPSSALASSSLTIANNSQLGGGVTGVGYLYTLCDATSGFCADPGNYQPISGMAGAGTTGTIPAPPAAGTWWLRIRATYNSGATAQWLPSAVGDVTAWPIAITAPKSFITPTSGFSYCVMGGCSYPFTGAGGAPITVTLTQGGSTLSGSFTWSVSGAGASPASGSGNSFTFTPGAMGTAIVSVTGGCSPLPDPIGITISSPPPPTPVITTPAVAGAGSPNRIASVALTADSTYNWTISNATLTAGQGTNRISFTAGTAGTPINISVTETVLSGASSLPGLATVTVAPAGSALQFYTLPPCRVIDTRASSGFPAAYGAPSMAGDGAQRAFVLAGQCGIPAGAQAVSVNVTVWAPVTRGDLRIFPGGGSTPNVSLLNWEADILALANAGIVQLGSGGTVTVQIDGTGTVDVFVDVNGYFQ